MKASTLNLNRRFYCQNDEQFMIDSIRDDSVFSDVSASACWRFVI